MSYIGSAESPQSLEFANSQYHRTAIKLAWQLEKFGGQFIPEMTGMYLVICWREVLAIYREVMRRARELARQ